MIIVAIDPGLLTGYAVIKDDELIKYGALSFHEKSYNGWEYERLIKEIYDSKDQMYFFIETQHMKFNSIKTTIEIAGYMLYTAKNNGYNTFQVYPSSWQKYIRDEAGNGKEKSLNRVKSLGIDITDHNIADAINIAYYGVRMLNESSGSM